MTKQDATRFEQLISSYDEANAAGDTERVEQLAAELEKLDEGWWLHTEPPEVEPVPPGVCPYSAWDGWG